MTVGSSDESELSSARIQLKLEDFQLGSARLVGFGISSCIRNIADMSYKCSLKFVEILEFEAFYF